MGKSKLKAEKLKETPSNSAVKEGFGAIDYEDTYRVPHTDGRNAQAFMDAMFQLPTWTKPLFSLRAALGRLVKLDKPKGSDKPPFPLISSSETEVICGEDAKHLNFRLSVLTNGGYAYAITLVRFRHFGGRLYFAVIKPFHKLIVMSMMKKAALAGDKKA